MSLYKIAEIEKSYPNWYDQNSSLSREDQQFIWENTPLSELNENKEKTNTESANDLNGNVNGSCKSQVKWAINAGNSDAYLFLKNINRLTPQFEIALKLQSLFSDWESKENHWLWISQRYTARCVAWQVIETIKHASRGAIRKTPPEYFTYRIKHRTKRKGLGL